MRYAIYFTPGRNDPLTRIAASWLGRDPFTGGPVATPVVSQLSADEIAFQTASARRYGFHATLKAPFRLADGVDVTELEQALAAFAADAEPVPLTNLAPARLDGFLALVPDVQTPVLGRFADAVVTEFDRFRAPLTDVEIRRRNPDALDPQEFGNLMRWGYPYVFETFRFHMTLTGRVAERDLPRVRAAIDEIFGRALERPVAIDGLALFVEPEPGAPFLVRSWHGLGRRSARRTA